MISKCPHCQFAYTITPADIGRPSQCLSCKQVFNIQEFISPPASAPGSAAGIGQSEKTDAAYQKRLIRYLIASLSVAQMICFFFAAKCIGIYSRFTGLESRYESLSSSYRSKFSDNVRLEKENEKLKKQIEALSSNKPISSDNSGNFAPAIDNSILSMLLNTDRKESTSNYLLSLKDAFDKCYNKKVELDVSANTVSCRIKSSLPDIWDTLQIKFDASAFVTQVSYFTYISHDNKTGYEELRGLSVSALTSKYGSPVINKANNIETISWNNSRLTYSLIFDHTHNTINVLFSLIFK
jgi:hypothetical protein